MIQQSPGYEDPHPSICKAAGAGRESCSQGPVVHQKEAWMKREEEKEEEEEEEAIKRGQWERDTACSLREQKTNKTNDDPLKKLAIDAKD